MKKLIIIAILSLALIGVYSFIMKVDDEALAQKLCYQGSSYSCWSAARYEFNRNSGHNKNTLKYNTKACDLGLARNCFFASGYYWESKKPPSEAKDINKAFEFITKGCEQGNNASCHNMGYMIRKGLGIEESEDAGLEIYKDLCEKGVSDSCFNVGNTYSHVTYFNGSQELGYDDHGIALEYYLQSCELGLSEGCIKAARSFEQGLSGIKDLQEAKKLRKQSENLGEKSGYKAKKGITHESRTSFLSCTLKAMFTNNNWCHPHLNVPQRSS